MEEAVRNRIIVILGILSSIFFLLWVQASVNVNKQKTMANTKAALSMELEEKNARLEKEKSEISRELESIKAKYDREKESHQATAKELSQEKLTVGALKAELERVTRQKELLEKEAPLAEAQTQETQK